MFLMTGAFLPTLAIQASPSPPSSFCSPPSASVWESISAEMPSRRKMIRAAGSGRDHGDLARVDEIALRQVGTDGRAGLLRHGPASEDSQHDADRYAHHATHTKPPSGHCLVCRLRSNAA